MDRIALGFEFRNLIELVTCTLKNMLEKYWHPPGPLRNSSVPLWVASSMPWKNLQGMTRCVPWWMEGEWVSQGEGLLPILYKLYFVIKWMLLWSCYSCTCCQTPSRYIFWKVWSGWLGHCPRKKKYLTGLFQRECTASGPSVVGPWYALACVYWKPSMWKRNPRH